MKKLSYICLFLSVLNYPVCDLYGQTPKPIPETIYSDSENTEKKPPKNPENQEAPQKVGEKGAPSASFPGVLDLDKNKEPSKSKKYTSIALLVFNIAMFTAGMALVKSIVGETV